MRVPKQGHAVFFKRVQVRLVTHELSMVISKPDVALAREMDKLAG
jgi:pterin-4a-carbinolamine dehydratase